MPADAVPSPDPIASAGAVVVDAEGRLLLIRRGTEPHRGLWSIPGGKCEPGERPEEAAVRELAEETGLRGVAVRLLGRQTLPGSGARRYDNCDWLVEVTGGSLRAGDDASDARWFAPDELADELLTPGLRSWLTQYGVLGEVAQG